MANCIDCVHFEVCQYDEQERAEANLEPSYRDLSKYIADGCKFFKNKSDFVEVKHGYWHLLDECANEGVYCSVCNKKVYKTDYANQKIKSSYCPNCGAKMDLKEGAEE